jgi:hypothetical protein
LQSLSEEKEFVDELMTPMSGLSFQESDDHFDLAKFKLNSGDNSQRNDSNFGFDDENVLMEEPM